MPTSLAPPLLADGYRQPIGIDVLGETSAKELLGLLNAGHISFDHPAVKLIEIRNAQAGAALSGRDTLIFVPSRIGPFAQMERQSCTIGRKLGPSGRFKSQ